MEALLVTNPNAVQDYINDLKKVASGDVRTDQYSRVLYSTDASIYKVLPYAVFFPKNVDELQAAVELAAKYKVPILPRTGGSSLAGQAVNEAIIIDLARHLDKVIEINKEERWVRVEPGVVLDQLNIDLRPTGLQFGPDPASSNRAAMGGIVSNNSTGSHSILYGMTADHVIGAKVILSDGSRAEYGPMETEQLETKTRRKGFEDTIYQKILALTQSDENQKIIQSGTPKHWRRCGGYNLDRFINKGISFKYPQDPRFNLAKLICGAEGTLAVMNEIKLNLVPLPKMTALAIIHYESLYEALTSVPVILEVNPSAVELIDHIGLTLCRDTPAYARLLNTFIEGEPNCILITEFYGNSSKELQDHIEKLKNHIKGQGVPVTNIKEVISLQHQQNVWNVRKVALGLMMSIKGDLKPIPFIEDAAVPVEHLADYVTKIENFCNDLGNKVAYYAHASAGCLHIRPLINSKTASEVAKLPQISQFALELLTEFGGALSSEHGDGRSRSWLNEHFFGKELYGLYKQVKEIFDPHNILNPGNIIDASAMTENLRYGSSYSVQELKTEIDFSSDQGFHRAIEMCNGAAICRKQTTGTMCPSFMVTREEEHSTRGRANALLAALSGDLPFEEFTSKRMYEIMELCIECKGCKSECPSSVDMAKIKFEFLAQYYKANGVPLRAKLFGFIPALSRFSSGKLAPIANWGVKNRFTRLAMEKILGITSKRQLPLFANEPFTTWFNKRNHQRKDSADQKKVVLFNDTFNTCNYPEIAIAATEVLEAAGFEVILSGHKCCGRPMISKGLVKKARESASETVNCLAPFAEAGIPIIGLEPSCLLSLRDEYLYLLPDDPRTKTIAKHAYMFDEFIVKLADEGNLNLEFSDKNQEILFHGHCHQKSLVGSEPTKKALGLTGSTVTEIDSGCCGMAGSFGYEAEHYDISMAIGEMRLFPAIRNKPKGSIIVAAGVSCRQQIQHGCGVEAVHPVQILRDALKPK